MKTWNDLKPLVGMDRSWEILKYDFFARMDASERIGRQNFLFFKEVMMNNPELINDFKHLLDKEKLKEVIDKHPLTKLYLE
jgi:hypothetical protein